MKNNWKSGKSKKKYEKNLELRLDLPLIVRIKIW